MLGFLRNNTDSDSLSPLVSSNTKYNGNENGFWFGLKANGYPIDKGMDGESKQSNGA